MYLDIDIKSSRIYRVFALLTNASLLLFSLYFSIFATNIMIWARIFIIITLVLIIFIIIIKSKTLMTVRRLVVEKNGAIFIECDEKKDFLSFRKNLNRTNHVVLLSNMLVLPYLMLLRCRLKSQSKVMTVLLLPDSMSKAKFQALSVAVQWIIKN